MQPFGVGRKSKHHWSLVSSAALNNINFQLAECVAVVEKRMVEDRVRPEKFNYSVVIHALGKAGQPRKAFEFFKKVFRKALSQTKIVSK